MSEPSEYNGPAIHFSGVVYLATPLPERVRIGFGIVDDEDARP